MRHPTKNGPIAIGGVGGSGTRLIAELVEQMGIYIGEYLNPQKDNLYFTLLFKRPLWFETFPTDEEIAHAIRLFHQAMTEGMKGKLSKPDKQYIDQISGELKIATSPVGVGRAAVRHFIKSTAPNLSAYSGWGWKEPNSHIFLPQLAGEFRDMKYIHIIRNGLDMAISQNQQQVVNWGNHICGGDFSRHSISPAPSLDYWIAANRRAVQIGSEKLRENFLLINYDDLCQNPGPAITELSEFLNTPLQPDRIESLRELVSPRSIGRHRSGYFLDLPDCGGERLWV